jgi:8-oxo-dGTP pyrophosphatase MutT (NUDIX family)
MKHRNPWKTVSSRVPYENPWIRVREDSVIRPDGNPGIYGVVEVRPSIGVVAINDQDETVLVGQWRYTLDRYTWEIPRGGSSPGETDMLAVAQRELAEEAGVRAAHWVPIGTFDVGNGILTDIQHVFLATGLSPTVSHQDPYEEIVVEWRPFSEAIEMILGGGITEVCSVAALLKVAHLRRESPNILGLAP